MDGFEQDHVLVQEDEPYGPAPACGAADHAANFVPQMNQEISYNPRQRILWLVFFVGLSLTTQAVASAFTATSVGSWYQTLDKPTWEPPGWAFPVVWTALYIAMGVAAWLVWMSGREGRGRAVALHGLQLALNAGWTLVFFYLQNPGLALVEIVALWLAILATALAFRRFSPVAAALMAPYLGWVAFAALLNHAIWRANP